MTFTRGWISPVFFSAVTPLAKRALKLAHITVPKKKSPSRVVACSPVGSAYAIRCQSTVRQQQRGVSRSGGPAPSCQILGCDWCCHGDRSASNEVRRALAPLCREEAGLFMNGFFVCWRWGTKRRGCSWGHPPPLPSYPCYFMFPNFRRHFSLIIES
jgi:hypothetical protein